MKRFKIKRKSERWVSNNRVLLGASKKDPGRNPNFDTEETKLLISLWGDPMIQRTLITTHRKHAVIAKLADKMSEYGYSRSAEEINTRIKNLKCFYNRLKKDIELGVINGATWKHFGAMDEIMTRSIFSVRPNEIPKPSLKYQLEIEQSEKEERNKARATIVNPSKPLSISNAHILEENISSSSESSKEDIIEDGDAHVNCEESVFMEYMENEDNAVKIKEEQCSDSYSRDIEETPLIIPKEEPFDTDEEPLATIKKKKKNSESLTPRLSEYIQISNNNSNSMAVSSNCFVNGNRNSSTLQTAPLPAAKTGITQSILFSNQSSSMPSAGKISLVPTNFLLQQNAAQPQQIQIRQQPQQRIICTQPNTQPNTGIVTSAGAGRMKVLLVNTFQNGKTSNVPAAKDVPFTNHPGLITTAHVHKTNTSDTAILQNSTEAPKQIRTEETTNSKDPGIEILFNKLIVMQNENNEIQRQRLEIERQRLEFEKSIAEKFLAALTSLNQVQKPEYANAAKTGERPANTEQFIKEKTHPPDFIDEFNFQLLTPKVEKID